jgi:cytochrome subunit of sulfide dehydrogenase
MRRDERREMLRTILLAGGLSLSGLAVAADPAPAPAPAPAAAPAAAAPAPALPMASAAMLSGACTGCHGTNGVSEGPASPTIAGISKEYFIEMMKAFKEGKRHSTIMGRIAKGYTDDEVKAMAGYFATRKYVGHAQKVDVAKVAAGKNLHKKNCEKCHEEGGRVSEDGGILSGQWMPYLHYQMEDFTSGKTKMPEKMEKKVKALSAADLDALINYYGSQK